MHLAHLCKASIEEFKIIDGVILRQCGVQCANLGYMLYSCTALLSHSKKIANFDSACLTIAPYSNPITPLFVLPHAIVAASVPCDCLAEHFGLIIFALSALLALQQAIAALYKQLQFDGLHQKSLWHCDMQLFFSFIQLSVVPISVSK